jgi:hypothetical protein
MATLAGAAAAQDFNARPVHGEISLETNFKPDPRLVELRAGGDVPAAQVSPRCSGFISAAPSLRLNLKAGDLPLILAVTARADTVLVVNGPQGGWYCNDDGSGRGTGASIRFDKPESGRYEIWVGTYRSGPSQPAELRISERGRRD